MGLLYSEPRIRKTENKGANSDGSNLNQNNQNEDPILIQAVQIIKNRKGEKYKKVCATDFCFRVAGILSLSPDASNSTKELKDIIDDVQRVYDDLKN